MRTQEEIEKKIASLKEDMRKLHTEREEKKAKYGGISEEENQDFFSDQHSNATKIIMLEWVLSDNNPLTTA